MARLCIEDLRLHVREIALLHPGKLTYIWKSTICNQLYIDEYIDKSSKHGPFSIARWLDVRLPEGIKKSSVSRPSGEFSLGQAPSLKQMHGELQTWITDTRQAPDFGAERPLFQVD